MLPQDVGFHVGWEQLHAIPSTTFNFSCRKIDIVVTKDGICTLVDIVIANPTQANLFPQFYAIQGFFTFDVAQAKERSYHNSHPTNQFLPLTNLSIWLLTQTCWCVFTWLCQCHLELERAKRLSSFYLGDFSS